jgi:hypothetical protein
MDLTGALILSAIGALIGFLVGALIFSLRRSGSAPSPPPERMISESQRELRFWREGEDRHLVVEIDGASYHRGNELSDEQNHRLVKLQAELQAWLQVPPAPPAAAMPTQLDASKPKAGQPAEDPKRTSLNPFSIFTRSFQPMEKTGADEPDKSIVEQIDEILQAKLHGTHLEERGIKLVEGPDQGMVIEVGLDRYRDIDSVPDEAVRQIIRVSVAEWENRSTE